MTMPKQLIEKRDDLSMWHRHEFEKSNESYKMGFDACYALMNEKLEAMRGALELLQNIAPYKINYDPPAQQERALHTIIDKQCAALEELKKWREE